MSNQKNQIYDVSESFNYQTRDAEQIDSQKSLNKKS